jgi:hypothetical protein
MLSLLPPAEADYLTRIESFIAARVATREAISGYAAVFDPLCKAYPYQAYLSHLDNKNMVYPLLGDDRVLSLFVNKLGHSCMTESVCLHPHLFPREGSPKLA